MCPDLAASPGAASGTTGGSSSSPSTTTRSATSSSSSRPRSHGTDRAERAHRRLPRPDAAGRARGDQAGLQRRPEQAPAPHPDRHRRRPRGPEPPDPLLEPVPLRRALEPEPPGAAQRPHRPQAPAAAPRSAATTSSTSSGPRTASSQSSSSKTETIKKRAGQPLPGDRRPAGRDRSSTASAATDVDRAAKRDRGRRPRRRASGRPSTRSWKRPASGRTSCAKQIERLQDLLEELAGVGRPRRRPLPAGHLLRPGAAAAPSRSSRDRPAAARDRFEFPALDQRKAPTRPGPTRWTRFARPRKRDQKLWEWRRTRRSGRSSSRTRARWTEDVVHLHLEHRVVQRLLGRFPAQGFVHHDLSRACLAQTDGRDPPRHPDRPALPLRPRRGPAARGDWSRSPPAGSSR